MTCTKGINWGKFSIDQDNLKLDYQENKNVIEIPTNKITNSYYNKQEIVLELQNTNNENTDFINEIRFFVPGQGEQEGDKNQQAIAMAEKINEEIRTNAKIGQNDGDAFITFQDIYLQVPKGKSYTIQFLKDKLKFHGQTYNFAINYSNITKAFILPLPNEVNIAFVFSVDKAVKQGNTFYNYIIIYFKKNEEVDVTVNLNEEQLSKYQLKEKYEGLKYEILALMFKQLVGVNIIVPGQFKSSDNQSCIRTAIKTNEGFLFPLSKSLIFITKPQLFIPLSEVKRVEIKNYQKAFELILITTQSTLNFSKIEMQEQEILVKYLEERKIKVFNDKDLQKKQVQQLQSEDEEEDSDDESYNAGVESSDGSEDESLEYESNE